MKKLSIILVIAILALTSCNNHPSESKTEIEDTLQSTSPSQEFAKLNNFLKKFEAPSQVFKVSTDKLITVKGKQGTIIHIDPSNLETEDGDPLGKNIEIELKEVSNHEQLVRADAQTISDGKLLVSGGAYYINATTDGKKVKLKEGKTYSVEFPKLSNEEMALFYGQRDSLGKINWKPTEQKFESPKTKVESPKDFDAILIAGGTHDTSVLHLKPLTGAEKEDAENYSRLSGKVHKQVNDKPVAITYKRILLTQFGWNNCDRFYAEVPEYPLTNIQYTITNKREEVNYAKVYLVVTKMNSILSSYYYSYKDRIESNKFNNIPSGQSVRILAVTFQNDKLFAALTDTINVKLNMVESLTLKEISEKELDELMKIID